MEIEGLPNLKLEQAFELTDATAERSCAGSTILLSQETVQEYLRSNICLLEKMIDSNYEDSKSISMISSYWAFESGWINDGFFNQFFISFIILVIDFESS